MRKFPFATVFVMIPIAIFASGAITSSRASVPAASVPAQGTSCTAHDLLVQKMDNAYHTQFRTSCDPPGTSRMGTSANLGGDAISGNQKLPQQ